MERTKLKQARRSKGIRDGTRLSQPDVADAIGYAADSYSLWERGKVDPGQDAIDKLVTYFDVTDPKELDLIPSNLVMSLEEKVRMLEGYSRREVLAALEGLTAFAGIDLVALVEQPQIAPDEFLDQCSASLKACWHLMQHNGLIHVESIVGTCLTRLSDLATHESDVQGLAASLAVEAKTLMALLAMHQLDYTNLGIHIAGAVRYSRSSYDKRLLPIMLSHQGNIYTFQLPSATRAIPIFAEGLASVGGDASLSKAKLSCGFAHAYALDGKEDQALEMVRQARTAMPKQPEQDPLFHLIDFGASDLDRVEGRVYLTLAEKIPGSDYAEKAHKAFSEGTGKQATSDRSQSQTLIHQADAALALGDLRMSLTCLEKGANIAFQIKSLKRQSEARTVLDKVPEERRKEEQYQNLVKMF